MIRIAPALGLSFAILALTASAEPARPDTDQDAARAAVQRGEVLPLPRILVLAAAKVPGDVIKVKMERKHGRLVYELKILAADGRVREAHLDAKTGAMIDVEVE